MLTVPTATKNGYDEVALPAVIVPAIEPAPAPRYVPPISVPMIVAPVIAPPPEGQYMGEGGTPFGAVPVLYIAPPVLPPPPPDRRPGWFWNGTAWVYVGEADYTPPPVLKYDPDAPAPENPVLPRRKGDNQVMPVPAGQVPARPDAGEATPQVTPVGTGPVKGMFLGADLSMVPLWAWLAGAAFVGARLLKG